MINLKTDDFGDSPLMCAIRSQNEQFENEDVAQWLIAFHADVSACNQGAFPVCVLKGLVELPLIHDRP